MSRAEVVMNAPFAEMRRLYDRGPSACGRVVDADGVMLGPAWPLVERTSGGYRRINAAALVRTPCQTTARRPLDERRLHFTMR
jgi:hypothetical protein